MFSEPQRMQQTPNTKNYLGIRNKIHHRGFDYGMAETTPHSQTVDIIVGLSPNSVKFQKRQKHILFKINSHTISKVYNCPDIENSKIFRILVALRTFGKDIHTKHPQLTA